MKKQCAFTICAKNYLGLARILQKSIKQFYELDFYIFIADEIEDQFLDYNTLRARTSLGINSERWVQNSFKYDVTEFCTYLKPYCFIKLQKEYEQICYFDPDILFFSSAEKIYREFEKYDFLVTPHLLDCYIEKYSGSIEDELRGSGIFNFGFVGLKTTEETKLFTKWWAERLDTKCFRDSVNYQFTDQIWGNYIFSYFDNSKIKVFRNKGMNVAPWNFGEREIIVEDGKFFVRNRFSKDSPEEIVFVHYSGFNYQELAKGNVIQTNYGHENEYKDVNVLFNHYVNYLNQNLSTFTEYINSKYSYNFFENGTPVSILNRRLFRALLLQNIDVGNPFTCEKDSFYEKLKNKKLISFTQPVVQKIGEVNSGNRNVLIIFNKLMKIIFKVGGLGRYLSILKLFKAYGQYENQTYLLDKKYTWLWYRERII